MNIAPNVSNRSPLGKKKLHGAAWMYMYNIATTVTETNDAG